MEQSGFEVLVNESATIDLESIKIYMCEKNIKACGNLMARHIAFEHKNEKPIDYYEIWIPIK